jgi:hypothetical protein
MKILSKIVSILLLLCIADGFRSPLWGEVMQLNDQQIKADWEKSDFAKNDISCVNTQNRTQFADYMALLHELNEDDSDVICINIGGAGYEKQEIQEAFQRMARVGKRVKICLISESIYAGNRSKNNTLLFPLSGQWEKAPIKQINEKPNLTTDRYHWKEYCSGNGSLEVVVFSTNLPETLVWPESWSLSFKVKPKTERAADIVFFSQFFEKFLIKKADDQKIVYIANFTGTPEKMIPEIFQIYHKMKLEYQNINLFMFGMTGTLRLRPGEIIIHIDSTLI